MKAVNFYLAVVFIVYLFAGTAVASQVSATASINQAPTISQEDSFVYLPIITKSEPVQNTIVKLVSPANDAVLDTLIPVFVFETDTVPDNTSGCLAFSTNPNPVNCNASLGIYPNMYREEVAWFNLQPDTTYYWRVGAVLNYDYNNIEWSEQRSFVTGPVGGAVSPAPVLVSPANNSLVDPDTLILQWYTVPGAVEYNLSVHDIDEGGWYGIWGISGSETQIGPDNLQWIFSYTDGTHFEWYITARNDYAWGANSTTWNFNIPTMQSRETYLSQQEMTTRLNAYRNSVYTQPWFSELNK